MWESHPVLSCRWVGAPGMPSCDLAPSAGAARSQKGVRRGLRGGGRREHRPPQASEVGAHGVVAGPDASLHEQPGSAAVDSVSPQLATANLDSEQRQVVANAVQQAAALQNQRSWDEAAAEAERLEAVRATLTDALERQGLEGDVTTSYDHRGLVISLVSRHVVFQANLASLSLRGQQVVDAVAPYPDVRIKFDDGTETWGVVSLDGNMVRLCTAGDATGGAPLEGGVDAHGRRDRPMGDRSS